MNRGARGRAVLAAVLLGLVVAWGTACDVVFQGMNARATGEWKRTYKLEEGGQVEVTNNNGRIDVAPSADATTVEVVAEITGRGASEDAARQAVKNIRIQEQIGPKRVALSVERGSAGMSWRAGAEVSFTLKVPRNAAVKVNTRNGEVHVAGLTGPVKADSTNGGIIGENLGGSVQAGTTNGGVRIHVTAVQPDGIRLDTTNGSIDLRVPADTKANISAHWVNGAFEASGVNPEGERERRRFEGKLNGGGPRIELNTTNGQIRISGNANAGR